MSFITLGSPAQSNIGSVKPIALTAHPQPNSQEKISNYHLLSKPYKKYISWTDNIRNRLNNNHPFLKKTLHYGGYLGTLGLTVGGSVFAMEHGIPVAPSIAVAAVTGFAMSHTLERILPKRDAWQETPEELPRDVTHMLLSTSVSPTVSKIIFASALATAATACASLYGSHIWENMPLLGNVSEWNPMARVLLGGMIAETGTYFGHRGVHEIHEKIWNFHAFHHAPKKLNVLKAGFTNAADAQKFLFHVLVLFLLNADPVTIAGTTVATTVNGFLQHANADFHESFLTRRIFAGADFHRIHHATDERKHTNYGSTYAIFDYASSIPDTLLDSALKAFPSLQNTAPANHLKRFTSWVNSYHEQEDIADLEVGLLPEEYEDPLDPTKGPLAQWWTDTLKPFRQLFE